MTSHCHTWERKKLLENVWPMNWHIWGWCDWRQGLVVMWFWPQGTAACIKMAGCEAQPAQLCTLALSACDLLQVLWLSETWPSHLQLGLIIFVFQNLSENWRQFILRMWHLVNTWILNFHFIKLYLAFNGYTVYLTLLLFMQKKYLVNLEIWIYQ